MKLEEVVEFAAQRLEGESESDSLHIDVRRVSWGEEVPTSVTFLLWAAPERPGYAAGRPVRYGFMRQSKNVPPTYLRFGKELRDEIRRLVSLPTFQRISYEDRTGFKQTIAYAGTIDELRHLARTQKHPSRHTAYTWPAMGEERIFNPTSLRVYPSILDM